MSTHDMLHRLSETLAARRNADPTTSYTAQLFASGPDSILKKIGEECAELIMAAKDGKRLNIVWESTDVIYHVMVLLAAMPTRRRPIPPSCSRAVPIPSSRRSVKSAPN